MDDDLWALIEPLLPPWPLADHVQERELDLTRRPHEPVLGDPTG
ncbi:hypothetical protein ACWEQP_34435 [Streptomyces sp. NPDC004044]